MSPIRNITLGILQNVNRANIITSNACSFTECNLHFFSRRFSQITNHIVTSLREEWKGFTLFYNKIMLHIENLGKKKRAKMIKYTLTRWPKSVIRKTLSINLTQELTNIALLVIELSRNWYLLLVRYVYCSFRPWGLSMEAWSVELKISLNFHLHFHRYQCCFHVLFPIQQKQFITWNKYIHQLLILLHLSVEYRRTSLSGVPMDMKALAIRIICLW